MTTIMIIKIMILKFILKYDYKIIYKIKGSELICEKRHKIINTTASPMPKFLSYIVAKRMNKISIRFPKNVSNKLTNRLGIANNTIHKKSNNVINPTIRLIFLRENKVSNEKDIIYIYIIFIIIKKLK